VFRSSVTIAAAALAFVLTAGAARAACQMQQIAEYHITMDGTAGFPDL